MTIVITGVGLNAEIAPSLNNLKKININNFPDYPLAKEGIEWFQKNLVFNSASKINREDRSLLNNCAKLSIDSAVEAFSIAESKTPYACIEKSDFPVFTATESIENNFSAVEFFSHTYRDQQMEVSWSELGKIKAFLHPLDMLRLLSTNPLYHVSKILGLHGGGYPLRRMSLSGLAALEEAFYYLPARAERALVLGSGDLKTSENLCAFKKMSLFPFKKK